MVIGWKCCIGEWFYVFCDELSLILAFSNFLSGFFAWLRLLLQAAFKLICRVFDIG